MLRTESLVVAKTGGRGTVVQPSSHTASHNEFIFSVNEFLVIERASHRSSQESNNRDDTVRVINRKGRTGDDPRDLVGTAILDQSATFSKAEKHTDRGTEAKVDPTETSILGVLAQTQHKRRRSESRSPARRQQVKEARRSSRFDPYARG